MSSTLQVGGLVSGLDTNAIIDALVDVERNKIRIVEAQKAAYEVKVSAYGELISRLGTLETVSEKLSDPEEFELYLGDSTDEDYATISGSAGAIVGDYTVSVRQRAAAEKLSSLAGRITDDHAALLPPAGTATIRVDGVDINVDENDSVRDLALLINNASDAQGEKINVQATVLRVTDSDYRLVLSSREEGVDNEIVLSDQAGSLLQDLGVILDAGGDKGNVSQSSVYTSTLPIPQTGAMGAAGSFDFNGTDHNGNAVTGSLALAGKTTEDLIAYIEDRFHQTVDASVDGGGNLTITDKTTGESQFTINVTDDGTLGLGGPAVTTGVSGASSVVVAQDAFFTVNGISVQSESNTSEDVATGVTFELHDVDPTKEVVLNLSQDYDGVKGLVQEFVDGYNAAIDYITAKSKVEVTESENGDRASAGPFSSDWTISKLKSDLQSIIRTQFSEWEDGSNLNALSRIGVVSNSKTGKLEIDDDDFKTAFDHDFDQIVRLFVPSGSSANANMVYGRHTEDTENGLYYVVKMSDDQYRIRKSTEFDWFNSDMREPGTDIIHWSAGTAKGLSLTIPVSNPSPGDEFVFTKGIAEMMKEKVDEITDYQDGYLTLSRTSKQEQIENYEDRISDMELDLDDYRIRLIRQFSDMEKAMSSLQSQSSSLIAAMGTFGG